MGDRRALPAPVTVQEMILHDVAVSLRNIEAALRPVVEPVADDSAVLKEPIAVEAAGLPDGFPGKAELEAAGIATLADVPRTMKALTAVHGIGDKTATAILQEIRLK